MTSRPPARHRFEDDDDDDFIPQAPKRGQNLEKASAGDKDDFLPTAPKRTKRLNKAHTSFAKLIPDTYPRARANNQDIDFEENKTAARSSAAAYHPGAMAVADTERPSGDTAPHADSVDIAGKGKADNDMEPNKARRSLATYLDASSATKTRATGHAALVSTCATHSTGMVRASNAGCEDYTVEEEPEQQPNTRVGAVVVPGWSPRNTSGHSDSTYDVISNERSSPSPAVPDEGNPLQATLVADREEADIEAQVHSRMRSDAENIANIVRRQIFPDPAMVVVQTNEESASNATNKSEKDNRKKKKWILLAVAFLVTAGAIAAGVAIPLLHDDLPTDDDTNNTVNSTVPPTPPSDIGLFLSFLASVSGERLNDESSPQYKALNWIANEDPKNTTVGTTSNETIVQRYVAAVLYFALGGEGWTNQYNFLSGDDICSWNNQTYGIICDSPDGSVGTLNMTKNGLSGSIPEEIGHFSKLSTIAMTDSAVTGTLPSSLADLSLLAMLDLRACKLVGTIPDFLYTHPPLKLLFLDDNSLTGTIPPSLGTSPLLTHFLVMNNQLTGSIPASVGQSLVLKSVDLSGNSLTGIIPEFSPSSQEFFLGFANNTLYGFIPSSIGNLHELQYIFLNNNHLEGTIPTELGQCQKLKHVSFDYNQLNGDIGPIINTLPRSLVSLDLSQNDFSGTFPTSIGKFTYLDFLDLGDNVLNGTIPSELGLLTNLGLLNLHSNGFNGTVPTTLASLTLLKTLYLNDNDLTGSVDALCGTGIDFERFAANTCEQVTINCTCCNFCCDSIFCEPLPPKSV